MSYRNRLRVGLPPEAFKAALERFTTVTQPLTWADTALVLGRVERSSRVEWREANSTMLELHGYGLPKDEDEDDAAERWNQAWRRKGKTA